MPVEVVTMMMAVSMGMVVLVSMMMKIVMMVVSGMGYSRECRRTRGLCWSCVE